jgi:hypothetical protein
MDDKTKKILGTLSPAYGLLSGQGAFGKLAPVAGVLPMALAQDRKNRKEEEAQNTAAGSPVIKAPAAGMKKGGSVRSSASRRADGIAQRGKTKGRMI